MFKNIYLAFLFTESAALIMGLVDSKYVRSVLPISITENEKATVLRVKSDTCFGYLGHNTNSI